MKLINNDLLSIHVTSAIRNRLSYSNTMCHHINERMWDVVWIECYNLIISHDLAPIINQVWNTIDQSEQYEIN
jgi:hypothetical protein